MTNVNTRAAKPDQCNLRRPAPGANATTGIRPRNLCVMSGPSRTGAIEKLLVMSAEDPKRFTVLATLTHILRAVGFTIYL